MVRTCHVKREVKGSIYSTISNCNGGIPLLRRHRNGPSFKSVAVLPRKFQSSVSDIAILVPVGLTRNPEIMAELDKSN
jgi:hypothetical protein